VAWHLKRNNAWHWSRVSAAVLRFVLMAEAPVAFPPKGDGRYADRASRLARIRSVRRYVGFILAALIAAVVGSDATARPAKGDGLTAIAAGFGSIWVGTGAGAVIRIDARTGTVQRVFRGDGFVQRACDGLRLDSRKRGATREWIRARLSSRLTNSKGG